MTSPEITNHETHARQQANAVQITICGALAVVDSNCAQVMARQLEYKEIYFQQADSGRLRHHRRTRQVFFRTHAGNVEIPVGCVARVRQYLQQHGYDVQIVDRRQLDRTNLRIAAERAPDADQSFPGLADAIRNHAEGILAVPRGQRRNALIGTVCHLLPAARTFIACSTQSRCQEVADALGPYVGGEVHAVRGGTWQSAYRVTCGTYTSYDTGDPANWDMLIFEDALEALGKKTHENRKRYNTHRVYACFDPQPPLSGKDQLKLEVLVGPEVYRIPTRSRRALAPIQVMFASVPPCLKLSANDPRRQREQRWGDGRRNTVISRVADAFARRDPAPLWEAGLLLDCADPFARWDHSPTVTVLVESAPHADRLTHLLPDWQVLHSRSRQDGSLTEESSGWVDWALPSRSLVTINRAAKTKSFAPDVIVMASGGPQPLFPRGLARRAQPVLIVDFADDGHALVVKEREQRRRAYEEFGCRIAPQHGAGA